MEVILNINDINYKDLFKNITLNVEKGKIETVSGANNCGKTTLVRILNRQIADNFNINLKGKDILEYSLEEYTRMVQIVFPNEIRMIEKTPFDELNRYHIKKDRIDFMKKELNLFKMLDKKEDKLTIKERIWTQLLIALGRAEELVVIDELDNYFDKKELIEIYEFFKRWITKFKTSILLTTTSLEQAYLSDTLHIIKDGEVILSGEPLTILQKDNLINKAGLNVPFMIDLSVKLRDYDLINDIMLEKEQLIDSLWN